MIAAGSLSDRERINSVRGLACLLLVAFHSVTSATEAMGHGDRTLSLIAEQAFLSIRMPLFSMIAGCIYAMHPVAPGGYARFVRKKGWRILVPCIFTTIILILAKNMLGRRAPCDTDCMLGHLVLPYEHLWFLPAIFCVFVAAAALDVLFPQQRRRATLIALAATCLLFFSPLRQIQAYAIGNAFYLAPFFFGGAAIYLFRDEITPRMARGWPWLLAATIIVYAINFTLMARGMSSGRDSLAALALGLLACGGLLIFFPRIRLLARIGVYSFTIYLYHFVFLSLANRVGFDLFSVTAIGIVLGLAGPILVEVAMMRFAPALGFLIGQPRRRPRSEPSLALSGGG
ncbi:acyltransferase 3 [Sphingomonas sp. MM-1]|uniref:acyltransferase family protein n=1 Tax=Sphingomonas sp. MM-1 TaxID=745310 RepID=UPI0002C14631|nr:acyltransferase [Sphingomonas sp. MM-1]AGH51205.1 acyltransferase 3 [Sphingomonas sp. MM-1]